MIDIWGDTIVEGPYYCHSCKSGDNLAIDDTQPGVQVVYCLTCDDIVHLQES